MEQTDKPKDMHGKFNRRIYAAFFFTALDKYGSKRGCGGANWVHRRSLLYVRMTMNVFSLIYLKVLFQHLLERTDETRTDSPLLLTCPSGL